jgi:hypothetical protein
MAVVISDGCCYRLQTPTCSPSNLTKLQNHCYFFLRYLMFQFCLNILSVTQFTLVFKNGYCFFSPTQSIVPK